MSFREALRSKDFVVTAHVNLSRAPDSDTLLRQGDVLRELVDAVQVTDNPGAEVHMSAVAAAALLARHGVDPVLHMTCRDRNRIALQSDLIGAVALGIGNILVMRGDRIPERMKPKVRSVFDTDAKELMAFARGLKDSPDVSLVADLLIGATATVFDPEPGWAPVNLTAKCDAGANFIQTQLCFDMDVVRSYMSQLVASKLTHRTSFLMALTPLPSAQAARWIKDNVKAALVPPPVIARIEQAPDPELEGIEMCAEMLAELATIPGVSGASLLPLGRLDAIPAAIEASGVRSPDSAR
ncbi:MAG: methylenetetrahydrofolate reductase [Gammaproteobacteria bacterium]|nr:methylenetetrahydrofolate reductase [Gammaproteobacteria bacterium]MDE0440498.1 methylenetetrahydrofolate reductase [Gammaproteobacteria bacterium]